MSPNRWPRLTCLLLMALYLSVGAYAWSRLPEANPNDDPTALELKLYDAAEYFGIAHEWRTDVEQRKMRCVLRKLQEALRSEAAYQAMCELEKHNHAVETKVVEMEAVIAR